VTPKAHATAILDGIFKQLKIKSKPIQQDITRVFLPIVFKLVTNVSFSSSIPLFKHLISAVSLYYSYTQKFFNKDTTATQRKAFEDFAMGMVKVQLNILAYNLATLKESQKSADKILNTVFVEDLVCDIGDMLLKYRPMNKRTKVSKDLKDQICTKLDNYNEVIGCKLTFKEILAKETSIDG